MDRPESWRKIVAEMRDEDTGTRFVSGDGMIASLHAAQAELRKLADRVKAACEALEVSRDSDDAFKYSMLVAKEEAAGKLRDVVVRAMGTCTTCKRTDCDSCINMNSYWIPDARAALAEANREPVTNRNGLPVAYRETQSAVHNEPCVCPTAHNAAKLREALLAAQDLLARIDFDADSDLDDMAAPVVAKIGQALAAPPRNCDVGTAEEQLERHRREVCDEYENSWEDPRTQCNGNCKACFARWHLAPAAKEGGEA